MGPHRTGNSLLPQCRPASCGKLLVASMWVRISMRKNFFIVIQARIPCEKRKSPHRRPRQPFETIKKAGRMPVFSLSASDGLFAEEGMPGRAEAAVLDEGERFLHGDVPASFGRFIDRHGDVRVEFAAREVYVLAGMAVAVDVTGEQAAFCQFVCHRSPRRGNTVRTGGSLRR